MARARHVFRQTTNFLEKQEERWEMEMGAALKIRDHDGQRNGMDFLFRSKEASSHHHPVVSSLIITH
jgi:hypothetical protein